MQMMTSVLVCERKLVSREEKLLSFPSHPSVLPQKPLRTSVC